MSIVVEVERVVGWPRLSLDSMDLSVSTVSETYSESGCIPSPHLVCVSLLFSVTDSNSGQFVLSLPLICIFISCIAIVYHVLWAWHYYYLRVHTQILVPRVCTSVLSIIHVKL